MTNGEFQTHTEKIEQLVQRLNAIPSEDARTISLELLQSFMEFHGSVMVRIVEVLTDSGDSGRSALSKLGSDPLICGLLVLYGIHPLGLEERVVRAMEEIRSRLQKQGGEVELQEVSEARVRLRIQSYGQGCGSSPDALRATVEQAILEAAPEVSELVIEGAATTAAGFVPLTMIQPMNWEEKKYEESAARY